MIFALLFMFYGSTLNYIQLKQRKKFFGKDLTTLVTSLETLCSYFIE